MGRNSQVREYIDKQNRKAWKKKLLMEHQKTSADTSNFCIAPFVHMYVHSNEGQRVCCMSTENTLVTDDLELDLKSVGVTIITKNLEKSFYAMKNQMYV